MVKPTLSGAARRVVCATLCIALTLAPVAQNTGIAFAQTPGQTPAQVIAAASARVPLKSVEQIRSEAKSYDKAVAEIASLASAPLDTVDQIKAAVALVDRDRDALKLVPSRLAAIGLDDKTFRDAVLKKISDEKSAAAFGKALAADTKIVMSLDGANALQAKFVAQARSDEKALHAAAVAMKKATDKQRAATGKKEAASSASIADDVAVAAEQTVLGIVFLTPLVLGAVSILCPPLGILLTLESAGLLATAYSSFVAAFVVGAAAGAVALLAIFAKNVATDSGRDAVAKCMHDADVALQACYKAAESSVFVPPVVADLECDAQWAAQSGICLIK